MTDAKETKTAEELAAMIREDLGNVDGCPERGVIVTVDAMPWYGMLRRDFNWIRRTADQRENCLLEGYPDLLMFAPDDATRNAGVVLLKGKVKPFGNVKRIGNIEGRPRNGHVAD